MFSQSYLKIVFDVLHFIIGTNKREDIAVGRINFIQIYQIWI